MARRARRAPVAMPQVRDLSVDSADEDDEVSDLFGDLPDGTGAEHGHPHTSEDSAAYSDFEHLRDHGNYENYQNHQNHQDHDNFSTDMEQLGDGRSGRSRGQKRSRASAGLGDDGMGNGRYMRGRANGLGLARKDNKRQADNEDWVPVTVPSVYRISKLVGQRGCDPSKCYFCRHVGFNLPRQTRSDMQKLQDIVNNMIEGADPILTAQDAAAFYNTLRERAERVRLPHEDSLPEMSAADILLHMRGSMQSVIRLPSGEEVPTSVLPHNRTPENMVGLVRDMLFEEVLLMYRQGSINRASAEYVNEEGQPYLMFDKDQSDTWLKMIDRLVRVASLRPERMHGYIPAGDRVVTNMPQGTLNVENKRIMSISAIDDERNHAIIQTIKTSHETTLQKLKRLGGGS